MINKILFTLIFMSFIFITAVLNPFRPYTPDGWSHWDRSLFGLPDYLSGIMVGYWIFKQ